MRRYWGACVPIFGHSKTDSRRFDCLREIEFKIALNAFVPELFTGGEIMFATHSIRHEIICVLLTCAQEDLAGCSALLGNWYRNFMQVTEVRGGSTRRSRSDKWSNRNHPYLDICVRYLCESGPLHCAPYALCPTLNLFQQNLVHLQRRAFLLLAVAFSTRFHPNPHVHICI